MGIDVGAIAVAKKYTKNYVGNVLNGDVSEVVADYLSNNPINGESIDLKSNSSIISIENEIEEIKKNSTNSLGIVSSGVETSSDGNQTFYLELEGNTVTPTAVVDTSDGGWKVYLEY